MRAQCAQRAAALLDEFGTIHGGRGRSRDLDGARLLGSNPVKDEGYIRRRVDTLVRIVIEVTGKYRGALSGMENVYIYIHIYSREDDASLRRVGDRVLASKRGLNPRRLVCSRSGGVVT